MNWKTGSMVTLTANLRIWCRGYRMFTRHICSLPPRLTFLLTVDKLKTLRLVSQINITSHMWLPYYTAFILYNLLYAWFPVLEDGSKTAAEKCKELKAMNVFGRMRGHIYHELFTKIYCPQFHNSPQVNSVMGKVWWLLTDTAQRMVTCWQPKVNPKCMNCCISQLWSTHCSSI